jgi:DNA-binding transcriptional regulator YhcF (GntR family)
MSTGLDLSVDRASEVPLGTQLIWKLRTLITTGALPPAARLPGIREVAEAAGVNSNTVRSVFARLEEQGLLVTEQGRGTFVSSGARHDTNLAQTAEAMIARARESGVDPRELAAALYVSPRVRIDETGYDEARERRALREQIERLELEIGRLDPLRAAERRPGEPAQPRMLSTAELREVRDGLVARLEELRHERQQWRVENEQLLAAEREEAEREEAERASRRPWRAGIWTGRAGAQVSWTSA